MNTSAPLPVAHGKPRFQWLRVLVALVLREMGTKFGKSAGGYLWALAEPLGGILLLAIAFGLALRSPPLGTSFILFYATGMLPLTIYSVMSREVAAAITSNKGLMTYPVVTVLDAVAAKLVLNLLTLSSIAVILFTGIIVSLDLHINLNLAKAAEGVVLAAMLGLGVGTVNCVLFGFFPTWRNIWSVLTRPLFIISGVFFLFESAPPAFQKLLIWNPLVHIIGVMRQGFFGTYEPQYISYPYVLGVSGGFFVVGCYLMRRHAAFLIEQ